MPIDWTQYQPGEFFDELFAAPGAARPAAEPLTSYLASIGKRALAERQGDAERAIAEMGITFTVYTEGQNIDRAWPFDVIPRTIEAGEWARIARGLIQRLTALNHFIDDLYHDRRIIADAVVPEDIIVTSANYLPACIGANPPYGVWANICGTDLIRDADGTVYVLEDNLRVPSGVSYMLENREVMMRIFPDLFAEHRIAPVENYPEELLATLKSVAPATAPDDPTVALLTPGPFNSAYYEHSFLADKLGIELVEGRDLLVRDNVVLMRTTEGPKRVDVLYRRVDDEFLDPLTFRPDSTLGVPGLMNAYRAGNISLANAVGTGVADDKAVYSYMPEIVRFYFAEEPILKNVPTWRCREKEARAYVLDHLPELVVKEVAGSGGYGMLIGPASDKATCAAFADKIKADPDDFIAQPTLALSTSPTFVGAGIAPRHVDLRPFVLCGADKVRIVPGGLTRVALKEGSLVVNSSQGGGTKDTWVLDE
jgi:uncharacterized circularly permuted ATP-grasp superfamily protein